MTTTTIAVEWAVSDVTATGYPIVSPARLIVAPPGGALPASVRPRVTIDLGLTLAEVGGTDGLTTAEEPLKSGQIIVHDRRAESRPDALAALELTTATTVGDVSVDPLLVDPSRGLWVLAVR
jgi:hypothetical protein